MPVERVIKVRVALNRHIRSLGYHAQQRPNRRRHRPARRPNGRALEALEFACDRIRVKRIAAGGISKQILFGIDGNRQEEVESGLARLQSYPLVEQPEGIANAALFLASDTAAFITGHRLVFDSGEQAGS
ncbi:MAG: SDR family oxidoreductase [Pseudomonadales bacterium]|nr:SDR family oxidoreductase [Pseudomonadales bacterium]